MFNRKVLVHTVHGDIEYYGKLFDLEKQAGDDFFRCHRSFLVNYKYVKHYDSSTVFLEHGFALMAKQRYFERIAPHSHRISAYGKCGPPFIEIQIILELHTRRRFQPLSREQEIGTPAAAALVLQCVLCDLY